jgi:hypothetical protein
MKYAFKMMAVVMVLLIPHKLVLAEKLPLDCKTIKKNVENIIKNNNSCGLTKPQSCYSMEVISKQKYNSLEYQIYIEGKLSKSYLQVLEERDNTFSNSLIFHSINNKTQTINYIFEDKSFSSKSMLAENENCNFLDLFRGKTSVPLKTSYNEMHIDNIPKWCLNITSSEVSLISCGIGKSVNKQIAKDLSILNAKDQLANILIEQVPDDCSNYTNNVAAISERYSLNGIEYYRNSIKSEFIKTNSLKNISKLVNGVYAHFELLEYIVPPKKKYTKSEIKQCKIKAEIDTNNAMKELESEINRRKKLK